jgi:hypothetical protein
MAIITTTGKARSEATRRLGHGLAPLVTVFCIGADNFFVCSLTGLGQLLDLVYIIIESTGIPSAQNYYLFNGDFVDRGMYGVEVMCILLALHSAAPG